MALRDEIGLAIRQRRQRLGLSQVELAERAGRAVQLIGRIERGRSAPSLETLEAISEVLDVLPRHLLPGPPHPDDETLERIQARLLALSASDRLKAEAVLAAVFG